MPSRSDTFARRAWFPFLGVALGCLAWSFFAGCEDGRAPYEVIQSAGSPTGYLPPTPTGVAPGTTREVGMIYRFDRTLYRLFKPLSGTDPRFVKRDSVLALIAAGETGAPQSLLLRPDLSDPTLATVYGDSRLFAFAASNPSAVGWVAGRAATGASEFLPLQAGNAWETIHNQREWVIVDSIAGQTSALTGAGMPVFRQVSTATSRPDLGFAYFRPAAYSYTQDLSSVAGQGIFWHAWTLIAERDVHPDLRGGPRGQPDRQRNPRFLWLSMASLGESSDPQASPPITVDQCLDGLDSRLLIHPFRLSADSLREGELYTTWTYLEVPTEILRQRLNSEAELDGGGRCGVPIAVGKDTLMMFPTRTFRLLAKFTVRTERILDQIETKIGSTTSGLYPRVPAPASVVKFVVQMNVQIEANDIPVQYLELYYLRGIGRVVGEMGLDPQRRSDSRLRSCTVNGVYYPPDNSVFYYHD